MKLRDLTEETTRTVESAAATAAAPTTVPQSGPTGSSSWPAGPPGVRWLVLESRLLDDEPFLVVFEKTHLKDARKAHPGKVIYVPPEIEELRRFKDAPDYAELLTLIHLVKKKFGAWIVPSESPSRVGSTRREEVTPMELRNAEARPVDVSEVTCSEPGATRRRMEDDATRPEHVQQTLPAMSRHA